MTDQDPDVDLSELTREQYCYVTSTGRVTGRPHRIEIWFGMRGSTIYMLSGDGKSDWVKNMRVQSKVTVELGKYIFDGQARIVSEKEPEDALARRLLAGKYQGWREGMQFSEWARTALPMAVDLNPQSARPKP